MDIMRSATAPGELIETDHHHRANCLFTADQSTADRLRPGPHNVSTSNLSRTENNLSSEAATPASIPHPRDLAFTFPGEKSATSGGSSDGQPSTPPSGYNNAGRRRASMHDAIDLSKIDTRLYDKKPAFLRFTELSKLTIQKGPQHGISFFA
ncbi:hypothetical protein Btru_025514 [Bulinus truncatus]|nr:hypothetical protein Btru_025514 [Bulinus truncatus]